MEQTFFSGVFSGFAQTIIGHPFDTWKTRIQAGQTKMHIRSFIPIAYRGVLPPLAFNGMYNAYILTAARYIPIHTDSQWFIKGAIAGFAGGTLCVPIEYLKIRKQCKEIALRKISMRNLFLSTCMRESIGNAVFFHFLHIHGEDPPGGIFLWGGFSGWLSWAVSYPLDTCKTRFQLGQSINWKQAIQKKNYYGGFGSYSIRCFFVNAIGWYCFKFFSTLK